MIQKLNAKTQVKAEKSQSKNLINAKKQKIMKQEFRKNDWVQEISSGGVMMLVDDWRGESVMCCYLEEDGSMACQQFDRSCLEHVKNKKSSTQDNWTLDDIHDTLNKEKLENLLNKIESQYQSYTNIGGYQILLPCINDGIEIPACEEILNKFPDKLKINFKSGTDGFKYLDNKEFEIAPMHEHANKNIYYKNLFELYLCILVDNDDAELSINHVNYAAIIKVMATVLCYEAGLIGDEIMDENLISFHGSELQEETQIDFDFVKKYASKKLLELLKK